MRVLFSILSLFAFMLIHTVSVAAEYHYYYQDKEITMNSLANVFAIEKGGTRQFAISKFNNSNALKKLNLSLVNVERKTLDRYTIPFQPVFDQGMFLMIPGNEVIVAFKDKTLTREQAMLQVRSFFSSKDVLSLKQSSQHRFIVKFKNCSDGQIFDICRVLSRQSTVQYAEPNLFLIRKGQDIKSRSGKQVNNKMVMRDGRYKLARRKNKIPAWVSLAQLDFESDDFLQNGWSIKTADGTPLAFWSVNDYRAYQGSQSLYCASGGLNGAAAPGPVPANMNASLISPVYDLSLYDEVYLELHFFAKNGVNILSAGIDFIDFAEITISDGENSESLKTLGINYQGDCTEDTTTDNGWRKAVLRILPTWRKKNVFFSIVYKSGAGPEVEGTYIDDLRIVATENIDSWRISNDTYSARQYDLYNVGQIAGIGKPENDMQVVEAWSLADVSDDVIVAICDTGVDLTHPDLNVIGGYNADGSAGGSYSDPHGTAVAGNVGAIGNNGRGVIGVAPNVKLLSVNIGLTVDDVASAIGVAVEHSADIINNSWGFNGTAFQSITDAISSALKNDVIVLFSVGNGPDREPWNYNTYFPASLTGSMNIIAVGGTDLTSGYKGAASNDGLFKTGSSYVGYGPDVCAPFSWSYTTDIQGAAGYNDGSLIDPENPESADYLPDFGGTSSSCPKVAGVVALMLSVDSTLTTGQVKRILRDSADDIGELGVDDKTGAGQVNAAKAVMQVLKGTANKSLSINNVNIQLHNNKDEKDKALIKGKLPAGTSINIRSLKVFIDGFGINCDETYGTWKESTRKGNKKYTYQTNSKYENGKFSFKYNKNKDEWQISLLRSRLNDVIDYSDGVTIIIQSSSSHYMGNVMVSDFKQWQFKGKKDEQNTVYNLAKTPMPGFGFVASVVSGRSQSKKSNRDHFKIRHASFGLTINDFKDKSAVLAIGNIEYQVTGFEQKGAKQIYTASVDNAHEQIDITLNFEKGTWDASITKADLSSLFFDVNGLIVSLDIATYIGAKQLDLNQTVTLTFKR